MRRAPVDAAAFIGDHLRAAPAPMLPQITVYQAHPGSGLSRLGAAPYWAYLWAGGAALAQHFLANPGVVRGLRVLDLGAGSGVVGIAAARAGAAAVICAETSRFGAAAITLNAALNGVRVEVWQRDITDQPPPGVDLIAAGDVFYAADLAARMRRFMGRCVAGGISVLIGDPGRAYLPLRHLRPLASYPVRDFGQAAGAAPARGQVFAFVPPPDAGQEQRGLAH